jgi:hypothetical protein
MTTLAEHYAAYDRRTNRRMAQYNQGEGEVRKPVRKATGASDGDKWDRAKFNSRKAAQILSRKDPLVDDKGMPTPAAMQFRRWGERVPKTYKDVQGILARANRQKERYRPDSAFLQGYQDGLRLDVQGPSGKGQRCGAGYISSNYQCNAGQQGGATSRGKVKAFAPVDRSKPDAYQQLLKREAEVNRAEQMLKRGRMKVNPNDDERTVAGKMGALTALRDAKDPKVGLVTARDGGKNYVGFLSYKPGRNQIEVVNMGTDGTKKGSGKALIQQLIRIAARENKSISIASVPSAIGFYEKMGFTSDGYSDFTMTAKEARRLAGL